MKLHQRMRRDQGRHADDWLITYADTITLLLCLFVVILSIKTTDQNHARDTAAVVGHAPLSEDIFQGQPPFHALTRVIAPETEEIAPLNVRDVSEPGAETRGGRSTTATEIAPTIVADVTDLGFEPSWPKNTAADASAWLLLAAQPDPPGARVPEAASPALPAAVDRLKSLDTVVVEQQGDRITTLQIDSATFFGSGYAALSFSGKSILRDVALTLKSSEFAAYHISIEGHTDDSPISTAQFQSNWELSTARAAAVVRFFLEQGIPPRRLTAAGYADAFPIAPNRTADGTVIPENQARNRRVVIRLEKIDKAER